MTTKDFTANVISASKVVPDGNFKNSKASGVWDINEALDLIKGGNWPNAANVSPDAFVDALFKCHLYTGNTTGTTATNQITTGIDLSNNDGLIWFKRRDGGETLSHHGLVDTLRGGTKELVSNSNSGQNTADSSQNVAFSSNGFTITGYYLYNALINYNNTEMVSWTFREQPKFFDMQTWTGNGSARTISHNLGSVPGMIMIKRLDSSAPWVVYHRGLNTGTNPEQYYIYLDTDAVNIGSSPYMNNTAPTSTEFTLTNDGHVNGNTNTYIAYLFAHNNDDGGFGEPGNQDIIKCGTYNGNGSTDGTEVTLGFEPQWVMIKATSVARDWHIFDSMRGIASGGTDALLKANLRDAEDAQSAAEFLSLTPTGFKLNSTDNKVNGSGHNYIYMAIRRGGMQTPTAASSVFSTQLQNAGGSYTKTTGFVADMILQTSRASVIVHRPYDRIRGGSKYLETSDKSAEASGGTMEFDNNTGYTGVTSLNTVDWIWKRARGYFDVVAYRGTGSNTTISHNLGVAPEMMWVKNRDTTNDDWAVYVSGITHLSVYGSDPDSYGSNPARLELNEVEKANFSQSGIWNHTHPTSTVFSVGDSGNTNGSGENLIAYLFATVAGVSKVGSFTQSGATNVDCGFTGNTPSFILLKRVDANSGNWLVFDSERGIVAGNDPYMKLDTTDAEVTNADIVDPYSGGFATTSSLTDGKYIFYAIAATS